jgi:hypothetical protein
MSGEFNNFPDLESFKKTMQDEEKRRKFYDHISADYKNFPSYEGFSSAMQEDPGFFEGLGDAAARPLISAYKGFRESEVAFWNTLDTLTQYIEEKTGLERGGVFRDLADSAQQMVDKLEGKGIVGDDALTKTQQFIFEGVGMAVGEIPQYIAGGLPAVSGIKGFAEGTKKEKGVILPPEIEGLAKGITEGLLLHKALKAAEVLPAVAKPIAGGVIFGGPSVIETLTLPPEQRDYARVVADIFVGGGLMVPSMRVPGKTFREIKKDFQETYGVDIDKVAGRVEKLDKEFSKQGKDVTERANAIKELLDSGEILTRAEFEEIRRTERVRSGVEKDVKADMEGLKKQLRDKGMETESERLARAEKIIADLEKIPAEMKAEESAKLEKKAKELGEELSERDINREKANAIISDIEKIKTEIEDQIETGFKTGEAKVTKRARIEVPEEMIDQEITRMREESEIWEREQNYNNLRKEALRRLEARAALPQGATFVAGRSEATIQPVEEGRVVPGAKTEVRASEQREAKPAEKKEPSAGDIQRTLVGKKPQPNPEEVKVKDAEEIAENPQAEGMTKTQVKENIRKVQSKTKKSKEKPIFAIKMKDGTVLKDRNAKNHADVVERQNVDSNNIENTGWWIDGKYESYFDKGKKRAAEKAKTKETKELTKEERLEQIFKSFEDAGKKTKKAFDDLWKQAEREGLIETKEEVERKLDKFRTKEEQKPQEKPLAERKKIAKKVSRPKPETKETKAKPGTKEARLNALRNLEDAEAAESFGRVTELKEKDFHKEYDRLQKERVKLHKQYSEAKNETRRERIRNKLADNTFQKQMVREALQSKTSRHFREEEGKLVERKGKADKEKIKESVPEGMVEAKFASVQDFTGIEGAEGIGMLRVKIPGEKPGDVSDVAYNPEKHFLPKAEKAKMDKAAKEFKGEALPEKEAIERLENPVQKAVEPTKEMAKEVRKVTEETKTETVEDIIKPGKYTKGQIIEHPQYGRLEIIDASDPTTVIARNERGTELKISKSILDAQKILYKSGLDISEATIDRVVMGDPAKEQTRSILRKRLAEQAQRISEVVHRAEARRDMWEKTSEGKKVKFMTMIGEGRISEAAMNAEFPGQGRLYSEIAREYRKRLDDAHAMSTDAGANVTYLQNYWPGIWKNPKKASAWLAGKLKRNPGFVKKKHHQTIQEGLDAGLKLKSTNPEELVLMREISGIQHRLTLDFLADMKSQGLMKFVRTGQPIPDGWSRLKRDALKVFFPKTGPRGGVSLTLGGDWVMPKEAARLVDNFLSPSLWSRQDFWGRAFRGASYMKNTFVSTILSMSGFHAVETSVSSIATQMTLGGMQIMRGNIAKGLELIAKAPIDPALAMFGKGGIIEAWRTGNYRTPYERQAVELMQRGGMRPEMSEQWQIGADNQWKQMYRKWIRGDKIASTFTVIPAIAQTISWPLMKAFVPRLKIHNYLRLAEDYIRMNPHLTEAQQNIGLGKIADVIDNRFGQLVYENLFVNRTLRDLGVFSSLSLGWNLGTFREFGGAISDAGRIVIGKGTRRNIDIVDFLSGKDLGQVNASPHRILYSIVYPVVFGTIGASLHYAMTGKPPSELLDYFYPKTGRENPDGSDERFQMPTMLKEVFNSKEALRKHGIIGGSVEYVNHKLNPLISSTIDLIQNKNFWGAEIRDPNAPMIRQAEQIAEFMGKQALPISIKVYMRHKDIAGESSILPFLGFNIAKPSVARTGMQNEIFDLYSKSFPKVFTRVQADKIEKRREVKELIFKGQYAEAKEEFVRLKKEGIIKNRTWSSYLKEYSLPTDVRAFKRLASEQQEYLFEKMTNEEKLKYGGFLKGKQRGRTRGRRSRSRSRRSR